jgi:hypothetical protein
VPFIAYVSTAYLLYPGSSSVGHLGFALHAVLAAVVAPIVLIGWTKWIGPKYKRACIEEENLATVRLPKSCKWSSVGTLGAGVLAAIFLLPLALHSVQDTSVRTAFYGWNILFSLIGSVIVAFWYFFHLGFPGSVWTGETPSSTLEMDSPTCITNVLLESLRAEMQILKSTYTPLLQLYIVGFVSVLVAIIGANTVLGGEEVNRYEIAWFVSGVILLGASAHVMITGPLMFRHMALARWLRLQCRNLPSSQGSPE